LSRADFLDLVREIREIPSSAEFDILTTQVVVRTRTWSPGPVGTGTPSDSDLTILPRPRVKESGDGTIIIEIVQPAVGGFGYTPQQLVPSFPRSAAVEISWLLTAPDGVARKYTQARLDTSKALHYTIELSGRDLRFPH